MYVSNLDFNIGEQELKKLFEPYGEVASAKVISDREPGRSRGFGFVEMKSSEAGDRAILGLNNKPVDGRNIGVSVAREKEKRSFKGGW